MNCAYTGTVCSAWSLSSTNIGVAGNPLFSSGRKLLSPQRGPCGNVVVWVWQGRGRHGNGENKKRSALSLTTTSPQQFNVVMDEYYEKDACFPSSMHCAFSPSENPISLTSWAVSGFSPSILPASIPVTQISMGFRKWETLDFVFFW